MKSSQLLETMVFRRAETRNGMLGVMGVGGETDEAGEEVLGLGI